MPISLLCFLIAAGGLVFIYTALKWLCDGFRKELALTAIITALVVWALCLWASMGPSEIDPDKTVIQEIQFKEYNGYTIPYIWTNDDKGNAVQFEVLDMLTGMPPVGAKMKIEYKVSYRNGLRLPDDWNLPKYTIIMP